MAYRANPFLERMSERTTSDQEFVRMFSPKVLERLPEEVFEGAVHIFRSSPGCGKTTLLRAFTPPALRAFWNARRSSDMNEAHQRLVAMGVVHEQDGPQLLGVLLSCASGYADLPPAASSAQEGVLRALFDCRVVLRALRSLGLLLNSNLANPLGDIELSYEDPASDLKHIPLERSASHLAQWAEQRERAVYSQLDSLGGHTTIGAPFHVRLESVLWLQGVRFIRDGRTLPIKRLLMVDDLQRLRKKQRVMIIDEVTELRPQIPVWLAERSIALGDELLSQGVREGRDIRHYPLEEIWTSGRHQQFLGFAQNVLDRRLGLQAQIPSGSFSQYLRNALAFDDLAALVRSGVQSLAAQLEAYRGTQRYAEWLARAERLIIEGDTDSLRELVATRTLIARDRGKRQLTLELAPLPAEELGERDSAQLQAAAEIFMHEELSIPYYFGIDRLCAMASGNVEELLALAATLYEAFVARQVLRKSDLQLSPTEQERILVAASKRRVEFIPKNHSEGTRAQRLLDAIGEFCRERTFLPTAPYAPGVTGIRLSQAELARLTTSNGAVAGYYHKLRMVIAECVAENLLIARQSSASTSRDSGTIFYLNRTLCANYGLPLQMGGWQDVSTDDLVDWMGPLRSTRRRQRLEIS